MVIGPIMGDLRGTTLEEDERDMLQHPLMGGVILFTRNYQSRDQIKDLITTLHTLRTPPLLIAVDHEGGPVQRFRQDFTPLPSARIMGKVYRKNPILATELAGQWGWLMAAELRSVGIDFSFAPVLDLDRGNNAMLSKRSIDQSAEVVSSLARIYIRGMRQAGMRAVGKHFPGHGGVSGDSHTTCPIDKRELKALYAEDMLPFQRLIKQGLTGIMPAHISYPQVDNRPASLSAVWLQDILRGQLGFQGCIFSDDLNMDGAKTAGDYPSRVQQALQAGCDMVLLCNNQDAITWVLDTLKPEINLQSSTRLIRMHGKHKIEPSELHRSEKWRQAVISAKAYQLDYPD